MTNPTPPPPPPGNPQQILLGFELMADAIVQPGEDAEVVVKARLQEVFSDFLMASQQCHVRLDPETGECSLDGLEAILRGLAQERTRQKGVVQ